MNNEEGMAQATDATTKIKANKKMGKNKWYNLLLWIRKEWK